MKDILSEMATFVMSKIPVIHCKPDPYIICTAKDEIYLEKFLENNGVTLTMSYLKCAYVMSQPTGVGNKSISNEFLTKYLPKEGGTNTVKEENVKDLLADRDKQWDDAPKEESIQQEPKGKSEKDDVDVGDIGVDVVEEEKKIKTNLNDSFDDWNGAEMKTCDDLVYKLTLKNTTNKKAQFKIKLNLISKADTPNLRWPTNGLKGTLLGEETTTFAFAKILPTDQSFENDHKSEIEKLKVELVVKQVDDEPASNDQNPGTGAGATQSTNADADKIK